MTMLSAITFTAPTMLTAAVLVAFPIAAHLLNRRAQPYVVFPTIRLLAESSGSQSHFFKFRRMILLILRCLFVMLLVAAFANPIWRDQGRHPANTRDTTAVVMILDLSASTGQRTNGVTAHQFLLTAAKRTLDGLAPADHVANMILADADPKPALPFLTGNFDLLRQTLTEVSLTGERADLAGALARARQLLAEHNGPRHLVIFSDLQATNWTDVQASLAADQPLPDGTEVRIVAPTAAAPANLSLTTPTVYPHSPVTGQPVHLAVKVSNHSPGHRTTTVDLTIDGEKTDTQSASLGPWQQREMTFAHTFFRLGDQAVTFSLPLDAMAGDDTAHFVARCIERIPVLIVGDDDPNKPGTTSFFLVRALAPRNNAEDRFNVRHVPSGRFKEATLQDAPSAILVSDTGVLGPSVLNTMYEYLRRGGGIVYFCGPEPAARNLTSLESLTKPQRLLPWRPGRVRNVAGRRDLLFLADGDWGSSFLREFNDRSRLALAEIQFAHVWSVDQVDPNARVLLKYSDGSVAMADRSVGAGRLVMANFTPALGVSDLGKHGAFVALIQSLAEDLRPPGDEGRQATVGRTEAFYRIGPSEPGGPPIHVLDPGGTHTNDIDLSGAADNITLTIHRPRQSGFYRAMQADRQIGLLAANSDARESDLRRIDRNLLAHQLAPQNTNVYAHQMNKSPSAVGNRATPLWGAALLAALAVIGLESALLWGWKR